MKRLLCAFLLATKLLAQDSVAVLLRHTEKAHRGDAAELTVAGQRRAAALPLGDLLRALGHEPDFPEVQGFDRFWVVRIPEGRGLPRLEEHRQMDRPR